MSDAETRHGLSPQDRQLLDWLGQVVTVVDPEPPHLRELGRLALSVRRVDAELAALIADSDRLVGVRRAGPAGVRLLSFELGSMLADVEVHPRPGDRLRLVGVIDGLAGPGRVDVETGSATTQSVEVDAVGRFAADAVPAGLLRLRILAEGVDVTTEWVRG